LLPLEEEGRRNDMSLRENLIECIFAYHRWTQAPEEYRIHKPWVADSAPALTTRQRCV
jgi:hypothetical protein